MQCEEWTERLTARVTGESDGGSRQELDRHVASCARCRSELSALEETWRDLARLPEPDVPSDAMRSRLLAAIPSAPTRTFRLGRYAAAAIIAVAGFLAGRFWNPPRAAAAPDPRPRYLLLLHERPGSATETAEQARGVVEEYKAWARRLRVEGTLVGGEKLADSGTLLSAAGSGQLRSGSDLVGGYFMIRAATPEEALRIARDCPHFRRGGTVELRRIEEV